VGCSRAELGVRSAEQIVAEAVVELIGEDGFVPTATLREIGLASIGLPVLVGLINSKNDSLAIHVSDLAGVATLGDLVQQVDFKIKNAQQNSGVGTSAM